MKDFDDNHDTKMKLTLDSAERISRTLDDAFGKKKSSPSAQSAAFLIEILVTLQKISKQLEQREERGPEWNSHKTGSSNHKTN